MAADPVCHRADLGHLFPVPIYHCFGMAPGNLAAFAADR